MDSSQEAPSKETTVYTGPNSQMQMYPRDLGRQLEEAERSTSTPSEEESLRIHTEPVQECVEAVEVCQGEGCCAWLTYVFPVQHASVGNPKRKV
jgi:hypothetical protein